jgi:hypothetical protein
MSSAVSTAKASNTELVDTEPPTRAGKRDVWIVFWIVPAFYTAFGIIFFALARVMPPPWPDVTTDQMVDFFHAHSTTIKIGFDSGAHRRGAGVVTASSCTTSNG